MRFLITRSKLIVFIALLTCSQGLIAQDEVAGKPASLDRSLKAGFDLLSKKKYAEAGKEFESAMDIFDKSPEASEWLFSRIQLADEDPGDATSKNRTERQITLWRHTMGTKQAIAMFLAFTSQLEGDKAKAKSYFDAVYSLQSPLWGLSWRMFIPPIQGLFHLSAPEEKNENYAWYLYRSGLLLEDAEQPIALTFFEKAQAMSPKDPVIAANLASSYVVRLRAAEAKSLALTSLSADPKQARVLIDLATAEWLLGELENAEKHAREASTLRPDLPGPHITLSLIAVAKNDLTSALREAAIGVRLSDRHPFYLAIQAIAFEASGKKVEADKNIQEAWKGNYPAEEQLKKWFLKDKPLDILLTVIKRQKSAPK